MYFSLSDLKKLVYMSFGVIGIGLIAAAFAQYRSELLATDPISFYLSSFVLLLVGVGNIFFCFEAYLLRGEDDIWQ